MRIAVPLDRRTGGAADGFIGFFSVSLAAAMVRQAVSKAGFSRLPGRESGRVWAVERWLVRRLLGAVGNPPIALVLWNGEAIGHAAPKARVKIHDRRTFWQLLANVYLNFGDAFSDGRVEVEGDLLEFLEIVYRSEDAQPPPTAWRQPWPSGGASRGPTRSAARDRTSITTTTSATTSIAFGSIGRWSTRAPSFPRPRFRWRKPRRPRWNWSAASSGSSRARRWSRRDAAGGRWRFTWRGITASRVKAYNVSREQIRTARERAKAEGLEARVEFIEDDYRTIRGQFDVFASIGMLEHVGVRSLSPVGRSDPSAACGPPAGASCTRSAATTRAA